MYRYFRNRRPFCFQPLSSQEAAALAASCTFFPCDDSESSDSTLSWFSLLNQHKTNLAEKKNFQQFSELNELNEESNKHYKSARAWTWRQAQGEKSEITKEETAPLLSNELLDSQLIYIFTIHIID